MRCCRGRFAFDFVHEDRLEPERLSKYRALLLPNIAMLSDRQCQQIRDYVQSGGSIMASFETGLYDENLKQRADFGLADLLGINKAGDVDRHQRQRVLWRASSASTPSSRASPTPTGSPARRIACRSSPCRIRCSPSSPDSCAIRRSWPTRRSPHTDEPAVVLRETGSSRIAYFPGDIERTYWLTGHGDLLRLLHNTIRWITRDERIVHVEGEGFIEMFAGRRPPDMPCICSTTPIPMRTTDGCSRSTRSARRPSG